MHPISGSDRFRAEQIRMLYRAGPVGVISANIGAAVLSLIVIYVNPKEVRITLVWLAVLVAVSAMHMVVAHRYWRASTQVTHWRRWAALFTGFSLGQGVCWGLTAVPTIAAGALEQRLLTMGLVAAVTSGSVSAFGAYVPAFMVIIFPGALPFAIISAAQGDLLHFGIALLVLVHIGGVSLVALWYHSNLMETLRLRFENLDLALDLKRQKEAAEEANKAKSRFFAAASHDLRQPVHALSLFVGALHAHPMAPAPRRLLENIESSVLALDGLFSALLDISRLDAGVVEPHQQTVVLQPLFDRLEREFAADAASKGLSLRVLPCSISVRSDPVLLERILRNLIANAVRYTDRGRVVVGAKRGARLRVIVGDTGRGIPEGEQERVFEEFFQLHNSERDRAQGMGLGLAIVRRLTALLSHDITLASVLGRGSIFSIGLPCASASDPMESVPALPPAFQRGLILVIDDEAQTQEAMRSLLSSWGHDVICAGGGAEMLQSIATCTRRPDLIISDYRLRNGENGIDVIHSLQSEFNEDLPALLITGDTAADRLLEARDSGFVLLHKPVANSRLRAAIAHSMKKELDEQRLPA